MWITNLGQFLLSTFDAAGYSLRLAGEAVRHIGSLRRSYYRSATYRQMYVCGVQTIPVTLVVSVFTGAILAVNGGISLEQIGQEQLIGRIVAVSMVREMGPFMTGLILAASVGSGMAAELGTMKVSEEIDALEIMSIEPSRFLVLPRLLAMATMTPVVTIYTSTIGIVGGMAISYLQYGVSPMAFQADAVSVLSMKDIYTGLIKAVIFGIVIATVGCSQGLRTTGGAIGVGYATRRAVVVSYLLIIVLGYYGTVIFFQFDWGLE